MLPAERVALSLGSSLIINQAHHLSHTTQNSKLLVYNEIYNEPASYGPWARVLG